MTTESDYTSKLKQINRLSQAQTAILRSTFQSKYNEQHELTTSLLKLTAQSNIPKSSVEVHFHKHKNLANWVAMATGEDTEIDIGGTVSTSELQNLREERNKLRDDLKEAQSMMGSAANGGGASNDDAYQLKVKLKDTKKTVKKLEKENTKLLLRLQSSQSDNVKGKGKGGGPSGGPPGGPPKGPPGPPPPPQPAAPPPQELLDEIQTLKESNSKLQNQHQTESSAMREELTRAKKEGAALKVEAESTKETLKTQLAQTETLMVKMIETEKLSEEQSEKLKIEISTLKKKAKSKAKYYWKVGQKFKAVTAKFIEFKQFVGSQMKLELPSLIASTTSRINTQLSKTIADSTELRTNYENEVKERKKLFNLVQELRGNIRVFCRCRPPLKKELLEGGGGSEIVVRFPAEGEVYLKNDKGKERTWEFDKVFDTKSDQSQVYNEVSPLVTSVMDGYNVCIFAYGQTGTGKTFTMMGDKEGENSGVNTRALAELFELSSKRSKVIEDKITVSILEVYNESIKDLLTSEVDMKYSVREGPHGMHVPDLTMVDVNCLDDVMELMEMSHANRSTAKTNMNEHSSRSHLILSCYMVSTNKHSGEVSRGKLHLIDLAGSERLSKSGATGVAMKEAQNINKSLSALGDVIAARGSGSSHIPFRNSTLTLLLQDSLSSNSKTLMFVCASPVMYNVEESFCSLNFAERARKVELGKAFKNIKK